MKTAQEIYEIHAEMRSAQNKELLERVKTKVDEFTESWANTPETGCSIVFTEEEFTEKFGDCSIALKLFAENGLKFKSIPAKETGHLWWKKIIPGKYEISIPAKKQ